LKLISNGRHETARELNGELAVEHARVGINRAILPAVQSALSLVNSKVTAVEAVCPFGTGKFGVSFELFPPKSPQGDTNLFQHLERLV
jgi:hypothetical protein